MNAQTVGWLVVLALIKNFSCALFKLEESKLTAKEGSCIEIKCTVLKNINHVGLYWFWMKNANWNEDLKDFNATIIYSTNNSLRPVSPDFADRVHYTGSPFSSWRNSYRSTPKCSILICNLNKTDSGNYSFRYVGSVSSEKWKTNVVNLTVEENPCPITFETPPVVKESGRITLTCSTLSSCPSNPQIQDLYSQQTHEEQKSTKASFTANWQDNGKEFSCQTENNTDKYLIRNVSITVEYAPKEILAEISPGNIEEGQSVTLTCTAKGHPGPTFTWYKNDHQMHSGPEWTLTSINDSQSGEYHCKAHNKRGNSKSNPIMINVTYKPEVEVKMTSMTSVIFQGDKITLTCYVMRSKPEPEFYVWYKDQTAIGQEQTHVVEQIMPEDRGYYTCRATNTVGEGQSQPFEIDVKYSPVKTTISISEHGNNVKVGKPLTFTCRAEANPAPVTYFWHRYNQNKPTDSPQWTYKTNEESLHLQRLERADEACYKCNATNAIGTGEDSEPVCIQVHYPPTEPMLSLDAEVIEDQLITISCTVESFPQSRLTLTRTSISNSQASEWHSPQHDYYEDHNTLHLKFNVTLTDTGLYTCNAENDEGLSKSLQRKMVVKYRPRDVTVQAKPGLVVSETTQLILNCSARAEPPVTSVTWMKVTDGKSEIIKNWNGTIKSVSPSDSGLYSCEASNIIGTGKSQQAEVKVKYAPKHIKIIRTAEQYSDGKSFVLLSCSAQSYPPATQYSWYKKTEGRDVEVFDNQNYTVNSNQPGEYYCIAKNEISQSSSDTVQLFDRGLKKALMFFILVFIVLLIIFLILFVYRRKRNKSVHHETTNTPPCFGFLSWWNSPRRRNLINEPIMAEPCRSRDDLLPDQPCRPKAQRRQPHPDSTPVSNISSVYCTVNLPAGKQGPSAQKPIKQQGGHTEAGSLNYANLNFGNKQKNNPENVVYAMVYMKKPTEKNEQEGQEEYENFSAAKSPNPLDYDTDTSEDEADLNYTQVNITAKPGHRTANRDSSSSDEEDTQYSEVKI